MLGTAAGCRSQSSSDDRQKNRDDVVAGLQMDDTVLTPDVPFAFCVRFTNLSRRTTYLPTKTTTYAAGVWFQELSSKDGLPTGEPVRLMTNFPPMLWEDEATAVPPREARHEMKIVAAPASELVPGRIYEVWLELVCYNAGRNTIAGQPGTILRGEQVWRGTLLTNRMRCYLQPEPEAFARLKKAFRDKSKVAADVSIPPYIWAKVVLAEGPDRTCGRVGVDCRLVYELSDPRSGEDEDLTALSASGLCGPATLSRAQSLQREPFGRPPNLARARRLLESFLVRRPESVFAPLCREQLEMLGK
ncbi:MAG TPA: hypothetical protein PK280_02210 [Planctomycetota bacterium]|nr:hypothetical protein [Planctomycetota bacterium]